MNPKTKISPLLGLTNPIHPQSPNTNSHAQHALDAKGMLLVLNKICVNQSSIVGNCLLFLPVLEETTI